jgi:hypothetical protein
VPQRVRCGRQRTKKGRSRQPPPRNDIPSPRVRLQQFGQPEDGNQLRNL